MDYKYDLKNNILHIDGMQVPSYNLEENEIGVCSKCDSDLVSVSYHSFNNTVIVVARCNACDVMYANIYDADWGWVDEVPTSQFFPSTRPQDNSTTIGDIEALESIPMKQLRTIFSPAEVDAMFAIARGKKYVRQYLYRARKKYGNFEEVFGFTLQI